MKVGKRREVGDSGPQKRPLLFFRGPLSFWYHRSIWKWAFPEVTALSKAKTCSYIRDIYLLLGLKCFRKNRFKIARGFMHFNSLCKATRSNAHGPRACSTACPMEPHRSLSLPSTTIPAAKRNCSTCYQLQRGSEMSYRLEGGKTQNGRFHMRALT